MRAPTLALLLLALSASACQTDADGDGWSADEDCDDDDPAVHPDATEQCNGVDDDCDEAIDEDNAADASDWYRDADRDGHGDPDSPLHACPTPEGYVASADDCDDDDADTYQGADEVWYDGVDQDCAGGDDYDADGDGHQAIGEIEGGDDCDDADADAYPGNTEIWYDGRDGDCSGGSDYDQDLDGHEADAPDGEGDDCDDLDDEVYTGAPDAWYDGIDSDCAGDSDWDQDGDGEDCQDEHLDCPGTDCDDSDPYSYPGADEICINDEDEDCDGDPDDDCPTVDHCGGAATHAITADETWAGGTFHLVSCDVSVAGSGAPTLTIADGARVLFDADGDTPSIHVGWSGSGDVEVDGHVQGVLFTSDADSPAAGDWGSLVLGSYASGSDVEGLVLEYGGGDSEGGLVVTGSSPTIHHSVLRDNDGAGLYLGPGAEPAVSFTELSDNQGYGLHAPLGGLARAKTPSFHHNAITGNTGMAASIAVQYAGEIDPTNLLVGNGDDHVLLSTDASPMVVDSATWAALEVPWLIEEPISVAGSASPTLTISDGAELEFDRDGALVVGMAGDARLVVDGHTEGVLMTSVVPGGTGDWYGLSFGGSDLGSELTGLLIEHGGADEVACIRSQGADIALTDSVVAECRGHGLYGGSSFPTITDTDFVDNDRDGVYLDATSGLDTAFTGNSLSGNAEHPLTLPADSVGWIDSATAITDNEDDRVRIMEDPRRERTTVTADATWPALEVPYLLVHDLYVNGSADPTLTLGDGLELHVDPEVGIYAGVAGEGGLVVDGSTTGVYLTTSAEVPDVETAWDAVHLGLYASGVDASLVGLYAEHGGSGDDGLLHVHGGSVTATDCVFVDSVSTGIYVETGTLDLSGSAVEDNAGYGVTVDHIARLATDTTPTFTDNTLSGNGSYPIALPPQSVPELDGSSSFAGNTDDYVLVIPDNPTSDTAAIQTSGTWAALDVPYWVETDLNVAGSSGPVLEFEAGTTALFRHHTGVWAGVSGDGSFRAIGTSAEPIVLDWVGSTWDGVHLGAYCDTSVSGLEWVEVHNGGGGGHGNVGLVSCSAAGTTGGYAVEDALIASSASCGITLDGVSEDVLHDVTYDANTDDDVCTVK